MKPCPFCGGGARLAPSANRSVRLEVDHKPGCFLDASDTLRWYYEDVDSCQSAEEVAAEEWNRRAERTWHDFADELPPVGSVVLCRGRNGALYVGKPVTFKGNGTRKVWVPRGDQYRTPEKWMEVGE